MRAKHALDRLLALLLLVLCAPVLLLISATLVVASPGPIFFSQVRVGQNGRVFRIHKFRTMTIGADDALPALLRRHGRHEQPLFKVPNDPRVTPVGRILRRTSLDELPQLINVLRGEMSLVGPRPQRPAEVALYEPHHRRRLRVRPGITGLWQVSGRSSVGWHEAVMMDLQYVDDWSLTLDLTILLRTVPAVLKTKGAA